MGHFRFSDMILVWKALAIDERIANALQEAMGLVGLRPNGTQLSDFKLFMIKYNWFATGKV